MTWRLAKSLDVLRKQVNARWPDRSKTSDGTIGDTAHSARRSDHNPDDDGVVCALDITHDPKRGCDSGVLAEHLRYSRDPRIKYVISNSRIFSGSDGPKAWMWRSYDGSNPHNKHVHISVRKSLCDDTRPWTITAAAPPKPKPAPQPIPPPPDIEPTPEPKVPWWKRPFVWLGGLLSGGIVGGNLSVDAQFLWGINATILLLALLFVVWVYVFPPRGKFWKGVFQ